MKVLIACEESQAVTMEFRKLGIEAYSCDILPCSGGHENWHLQCDVKEVLNDNWDLIIAFPPCTYLTVTGNKWFNIEKYQEAAIKRHVQREIAINFFKLFINSTCQYVAIENPVGIMSTIWRKPDQIINPYQFGDPFEKKTCLWLKGLPKLIPTKVVTPEPRKIFISGKSMPSWYANAWSLPPNQRASLRSKTFHGIAQAMAEQWSTYIQNSNYLF